MMDPRGHFVTYFIWGICVLGSWLSVARRCGGFLGGCLKGKQKGAGALPGFADPKSWDLRETPAPAPCTRAMAIVAGRLAVVKWRLLALIHFHPSTPVMVLWVCGLSWAILDPGAVAREGNMGVFCLQGAPFRLGFQAKSKGTPFRHFGEAR